MFVKAFSNADNYTMMSLNDSIFHACQCFGARAFEIAEKVMPFLV